VKTSYRMLMEALMVNFTASEICYICCFRICLAS